MALTTNRYRITRPGQLTVQSVQSDQACKPASTGDQVQASNIDLSIWAQTHDSPRVGAQNPWSTFGAGSASKLVNSGCLSTDGRLLQPKKQGFATYRATAREGTDPSTARRRPEADPELYRSHRIRSADSRCARMPRVGGGLWHYRKGALVTAGEAVEATSVTP